MSVWDDLVATALVGAGNAPLSPLAGGTSSLDALLQELNGRSEERRLLDAAAAVSTWRRAGALPLTLPIAPPGEAPPEDRDECAPASAEHLARMLHDQALAPVLPEWLAAMATAGQHLPPRWLPETLDAASRSDDVRLILLPVLGQRGVWLSAQNPTWAGLSIPTERTAMQERWQTAPFADRLSLLRHVRCTDPAFGRELVTSTWEQEPPREREAFLSALQVNLSMEDESLAEAALDDRRKEVRAVAVDLAASLPDSHLCRRMSERVRPLLQFQSGERPSLRNLGRGRRATLQVALPESCDKGMQRDGIGSKMPSVVQMGERAGWLAQMLGAVPIRLWTDAWGVSPGELIDAAVENEWREPLCLGWEIAALRARDAIWSEALVRFTLDRIRPLANTDKTEERAIVQVGRTLVEQLWPVLTYERQEALVIESFRSGGELLYDQHPAVWLLTLSSCAWSELLSRRVLACLRATVRKSDPAQNRDWQLRSFLKQYARRVAPSLAGEAGSGWDRNVPSWGHWSSAVDEFLTILQFRHDMLDALQSRTGDH